MLTSFLFEKVLPITKQQKNCYTCGAAMLAAQLWFKLMYIHHLIWLDYAYHTSSVIDVRGSRCSAGSSFELFSLPMKILIKNLGSCNRPYAMRWPTMSVRTGNIF